MQKSTYIKEKVEELARLLLPLGISHITIYITGSRDLFCLTFPSHAFHSTEASFYSRR